MDAHEELGINPDATTKQIRIAFLKLARLYHPDMNATSEAKIRYLRAQQAYDKLTKPDPSRQPETVSSADQYMPAGDLWRAYINNDATLTDVIEEMIKQHLDFIMRMPNFQPPHINVLPPRFPPILPGRWP